MNRTSCDYVQVEEAREIYDALAKTMQAWLFVCIDAWVLVYLSRQICHANHCARFSLLWVSAPLTAAVLLQNGRGQKDQQQQQYDMHVDAYLLSICVAAPARRHGKG